MKRRILLLLILTLGRLGLIFLSTGVGLGKQARYLFNSVNISRTASECVVRSGRIFVMGTEVCGLLPGRNYQVIGRTRAGVIDRALGRVWLDKASFSLNNDVSSAGKSVISMAMRAIGNWRLKLVGIASKVLPEPESALVLGVVLGYKSSLSVEFYQSLINSGTVHMVVASGYNIMVVAGLALSVFLYLVSRGWASFLSIMVMIFYVALTGGEVSVLRAAVMGSMVFVGSALGRGAKAWWSLSFTAWLLLMVDPLIIESISFQLSVAATFGVTVLAPDFKQRLAESGASLTGLVERLDLTTSLGALLLTWPIIWFHFGRGSLISLASNGVILPLVPLLMALGGMMLVAGLFSSPLGLVLSWPTYALAHLVVILVRIFGG